MGTYKCKGKRVTITDEKIVDVHRLFLVVICDKCSNVPVCHLLERRSDEIQD